MLHQFFSILSRCVRVLTHVEVFYMLFISFLHFSETQWADAERERYCQGVEKYTLTRLEFVEYILTRLMTNDHRIRLIIIYWLTQAKLLQIYEPWTLNKIHKYAFDDDPMKFSELDILALSVMVTIWVRNNKFKIAYVIDRWCESMTTIDTFVNPNFPCEMCKDLPMMSQKNPRKKLIWRCKAFETFCV